MKKITISTDVLKPALKKLGLVISNKPVLPTMSCCFFKVSPKEVELITTDMELTVIYRIPAEATGSFEMLIPFDFLHKVVGLSGSQPISIEHPSMKVARIIAEKDVFELKSLEKVQDFPKIPDMPKKNCYQLDEATLERVHDSMHSSGKDDNSPAMMKSCLDFTSDDLTIVSTDAHMLYTYRIPQGTDTPDQLLISTKMAKALEGIGCASVFWHKNHISFRTEKITLIATRYADRYPNYKVVIPNHEANLTIRRMDLILALEKALLASHLQVVLKLTEKQGAIVVRATDIDFGRNVESVVPCSYTGKAEFVALDPEKLLTILRQIEYQEVNLHIDGPVRGVVITATEDPKYKGMIMPSKLDA